jgi:hypothetical protein
MKATKVPPKPEESTFSITELSGDEYQCILACLKHCSGGHIDVGFRNDGLSLPGLMYNALARVS